MKNLFNAQGRLNRLRYFIYTIAISIVIAIVQAVVGDTESLILLLMLLVVSIVGAYVSICITIKRFHDLDRPGLHFLLLFIPLYNIYIALILLFKKGTVGSNKYGENPLA